MIKQSARLRRIFIGTGVLGGLILALTLTFKLWVQPLVDQAVRLGLAQLNEQGYQVDYQKISFRPFQRLIALHQVTFEIDSVRLKSRNYFTGNVDKFEIKLEKYPFWESERYLGVDHISIQNPSVWFHQSDSAAQDETGRQPQNLDFYALIQPYLDSLSVKSIRVENGSFKRIKQGSEARDTLGIPGVNLAIDELFVDSLHALNNKGLPSLASLVITVNSLQRISQDSLYSFSVANTELNLLDSTISMKGLEVSPNFSNKELLSYYNEQKDRFDVKIASLQLMGIQPARWLASQQFLCSHISIDTATLAIFKDKRLPRNQDVKPLLQSMLLSVPYAIKVDTITLKASRIVYEERNAESVHPGKITFDQLYASLYGVTNIPEFQSTLQADIRANLMNSGLLKLSIQAPLNSDQKYHQIDGELDKMHLGALNSFLEPVAFASVKSGILNKLKFSITADQHASEGKVHFIYDDLKVSLLNPEDPNNPAIKELVGTWLANWFVIKADNPTRNQPLRVGNIYYERDPSRSMFNYWCHSLLSGLKESIGMPSPTEEVTTSIQTISEEEQERPGLLKRIFKKSQD